MNPRTLTLIFFLLSWPVPVLPAQEFKERASFNGYTFGVQQVVLSPDGRILASGGGDSQGRELKLWDTGTGKEMASLSGHSDSLTALAFSRDGKLLASADHHPEIILWEVPTGKRRATLKGHGEPIRAVALSPDGKRLASAAWKEAKLWDLASGKEITSFRRKVDAVRVAFSGDLRTLASPNYQEIDLWDLSSGKERITLGEHRGSVRCVAFSADDQTLAAASAWDEGDFHFGGQVKLWDVATGKERSTLPGPFGEALALALSPDATTLAMLERKELEADIELRVLDVATGRQILVHRGQARSFMSVAFTGDGRLFVLGTSGDTTVKLWEALLPRPGGR